jgi:DNA end-binding protein Ku
MTGHWDASMACDPTQEKLLEIIAAKRKGVKKRVKATPQELQPKSNVVNILDALRKSIRAERER